MSQISTKNRSDASVIRDRYDFHKSQLHIKHNGMGVALKYWIIGDVLSGIAGWYIVWVNGIEDIKSIIVFIAFVFYTFFTLKKAYWEGREKRINAKEKEWDFNRKMDEHKPPQRRE